MCRMVVFGGHFEELWLHCDRHGTIAVLDAGFDVDKLIAVVTGHREAYAHR
ncbi:MAG: hypothetical protein ACLFWM_08915 [Actinomycetota bacterium]